MVPRGVEVGAGLEQRHDVERQRPGPDREPRQRPHRHEVAGRLAERHDVAPTAASAPPLLQPRHHPQGVEHLTGGRAHRPGQLGPALDRQPVERHRVGCRGGGVRGPPTARGQQTEQLAQRGAVHRAVLAHLELGEVEAERAQHPDHVLQLAVRGPGVTRGHERVLHQGEVLECLFRPAVGQPGAFPPGGVQPGGDDEQLLPVRLVGGVLGDLREQPGVGRRVVGQCVAQGGGRRRRLLVDGDHPGHPVDRVVQDLQRLVGVRRDRLAGHLRRDERVAVAVAADPRPEPHDGRQRLGLRVLTREGDLDGPLEAGHGVHERLPEDGEHGLHLVGRGGPGDPQRRRALQDVDVLEHPPPGLGALRGPGLRVVVRVQAVGDPAQGRGDRTAARLGGVCGEHRVNPHPLDPRAGVRAGGRHGRPDVAGVGAAPELAVLAAQRAGPLPLLGEVGEVQVHGEQPGDPLGGVGIELGDQRGRRVGVVGPAARLELVGDLEQVGAARLDDHLPVQGREEGQVVEHARHAQQPRVGQRCVVESVRPSVESSR